MEPVVRSLVIQRPVDVVAAQFADVAHHERAAPHRKVRFTVLDEQPDEVRYRQRSRIGPAALRQTMVLDRRDPLHLVNTAHDGALVGSTLVFDIGPVGADVARVTVTLRFPSSPLARMLGPLLRPLVGRDLAAALDEDRRDLEESYEPTG